MASLIASMMNDYGDAADEDDDAADADDETVDEDDDAVDEDEGGGNDADAHWTRSENGAIS